MGSPLTDSPNGVLAVVTTDLTDFIQNASLRWLGTLVITLRDSVHVNLPALQLHALTSSLEKIRLSETSQLFFQP
jgi:hypothetical protein